MKAIKLCISSQRLSISLDHAEAMLYGNHNEAIFPFEKVQPQLSWLPPLLAKYVDTSPVDPSGQSSFILVNILLVATGARTSACQFPLKYFEDGMDMISRINKILADVGAEEFQLETHPAHDWDQPWNLHIHRRNSSRYLRRRHITPPGNGKKPRLLRRWPFISTRRRYVY